MLLMVPLTVPVRLSAIPPTRSRLCSRALRLRLERDGLDSVAPGRFREEPLQQRAEYGRRELGTHAKIEYTITPLIEQGAEMRQASPEILMPVTTIVCSLIVSFNM